MDNKLLCGRVSFYDTYMWVVYGLVCGSKTGNPKKTRLYKSQIWFLFLSTNWLYWRAHQIGYGCGLMCVHYCGCTLFSKKIIHQFFPIVNKIECHWTHVLIHNISLLYFKGRLDGASWCRGTDLKRFEACWALEPYPPLDLTFQNGSPKLELSFELHFLV